MYAPVSVRLLWGVPAKSRNLHNSAYTSRTANLALCASFFFQQPLIILFHKSLIFEKKIPLFSDTDTISVARISLMNREGFQAASLVSLVTRQFLLFCMTGVGALLS